MHLPRILAAAALCCALAEPAYAKPRCTAPVVRVVTTAGDVEALTTGPRDGEQLVAKLARQSERVSRAGKACARVLLTITR
jgi:hypothetical protein